MAERDRRRNISAIRSSTFWRSAMDHIEHSRGHEWAFQGDVAYNFLDDSLPEAAEVRRALCRPRAGHQLHDLQLGRAERGLDRHGRVHGPGRRAAGRTSRLHSSTTSSAARRTRRPRRNYYNGNLINGYDAGGRLLPDSSRPMRSAHGGGGATSWVPLAARPGVVPGTPFLPSEIQHVDAEDRRRLCDAELRQ